jgi:hypothetical protein
MMEWLCVANHVSSVEEIFGWTEAVSFALLAAGFFWTLYMALEPYVRRRWPQSIIAWSRLLGGGVRDPVVGGNLLIGAVCGVGVAAFWRIYSLIVQVYGSGVGRLELNSVVAARQAAGEILHEVIWRIGFSLVLFFLFFLLRALLRKSWIAAAAFIVLLVALTSGSVSHPLLAPALTAIGPALILFITIRFGVLAMTVNFFSGAMLLQFPATTDLSTWYAGSTLFAYAVVLALAGYAFHTAVAGRPLFKAGFLDAD